MLSGISKQDFCDYCRKIKFPRDGYGAVDAFVALHL